MRRRILISAISSWKIFLQSSLICGLLASILFAMNLRRIEPLPLNLDPPKFQGARAYHSMFTLAKNFPNRVTWGPNRVKAATWLKQELTRLGYQPKGMKFSEVIAGTQYTQLENIYAEKRGTRHPDEIIVAMAHYDITDTTVEGAMDDGSGVGLVLELAAQFAKIETDRTLVFLLTDSEEYGAFWGARAFTESYENADKIIAALNVDFISPEKQTQILTLCDGLKTGYTPLWLREIGLNSIRSFGKAEAKDLYGLEEFIERALQIPPADHGAFLAAGIPAFNWVGQPKNFSYIMAHYHHTPADVAEALEVESFTQVGQAAERAIKSIDQLPKLPNNWRDSSYWKVSEHYYLPGWTSTLIQILAFLPFVGLGIVKFTQIFQNRKKQDVFLVVNNELKRVLILFSSMLFGYGLMLLLPALRLITLYETFPATQKSLMLYSPNLLIMTLVFASSYGVHRILSSVFYENLEADSHDQVRHSVQTALLALIIFLAFLKNSYLGTLLLLPPAYFWTTLSRRRHKKGRALNVALILSGTITFIAIAAVLNTVFHVGVFYWYLFLSATYGLISAYSVVLFLLAMTVMTRLFKSFVF